MFGGILKWFRTEPPPEVAAPVVPKADYGPALTFQKLFEAVSNQEVGTTEIYQLSQVLFPSQTQSIVAKLNERSEGGGEVKEDVRNLTIKVTLFK